MKYSRTYLGISFVSDTVNLSDKRITDLFSIAYDHFCCNGCIPSNKQIALLLQQHGVKAVEIVLDPTCKFQFKAEFLY